jgi:hypothetical protein
VLLIGWKEAKAAGLERYLTGIPCRLGHIAERRVKGLVCVECSAIAKARYSAVDKPGRPE